MINPLLFSQASKYRTVLWWMLKDAYTVFKKEILIVLFSSMFGVFIQGSALTLILRYTSYLQHDKPIMFLDFIFPSRATATFISMALISLILLIISAYLIYLSKKIAAALSVDYEEYCSKRIYSMIGPKPIVELKDPNSIRFLAGISRSQSNSAVGCGRALLTVLNGSHPSIVAIGMSGFLLYLNYKMSLIMFFFLIIFAIYHYKLNIKVVENERRLHEVELDARKELRNLFYELRMVGDKSSFLKNDIEKAYKSKNVSARFDGHRIRRVSVSKADFISNLMIAVAVTVIFVYLGSEALEGNANWGEVIVYLVALRITVMGLRSVLNTIAVYARWYPRVSAFRRICGVYKDNNQAAPDNPELVIVNFKKTGNIKKIVIRPGDKIGVLAPIEINRYTLSYYLNNLLCLTEDEANIYKPLIGFLPESPKITEGIKLRELLGLPHDTRFREIEEIFTEFKILETMRKIAEDNLDTILTKRIIENLSTEQLSKLCLAALYFKRNKILFLSENAMAAMGEDVVKNCSRIFSDRIIFIIYDRGFPELYRFNEKAFIIGDNSKQCCMGTVEWVYGNKENILSVMEKYKTYRNNYNDNVFDEDEEDADV